MPTAAVDHAGLGAGREPSAGSTKQRDAPFGHTLMTVRRTFLRFTRDDAIAIDRLHAETSMRSRVVGQLNARIATPDA